MHSLPFTCIQAAKQFAADSVAKGCGAVVLPCNGGAIVQFWDLAA